jgi:hypothetical protein
LLITKFQIPDLSPTPTERRLQETKEDGDSRRPHGTFGVRTGPIHIDNVDVVAMWRWLGNRTITLPAGYLALGALPVCAIFGLYFWPSAYQRDQDEPRVYYAFYGDLDRTGNMRFKQQTMNLYYSKQSAQVHGRATGKTSDVGGGLHDTTWVFAGYHVADNLVLAESREPDRNDPTPTSAATYQLQRVGSSFSGIVTYWDRCLLSVVRCPVILSNVDMNIDAARGAWPNQFQQVCSKVDLVPDKSLPIASSAVTTCPGTVKLDRSN